MAESPTPGFIEFARWATEVENDDLTFAGISYFATDHVLFPDLELALPGAPQNPEFDLVATFFSREKQAIVRVLGQNVGAFRVLDEGGLVDLWVASKERPRPGRTTFRVRGHGWQQESELEWVMGAPPDGYSYMVATRWQCLEMICYDPPHITIEAASVRRPS